MLADHRYHLLMRRTHPTNSAPSVQSRDEFAKGQSLSEPQPQSGNQPASENPSGDPWHEPLVKSDEVTAYLRVTRQTVQRWSRLKVDPLPVLKFGLRGFERYRMSDVYAWVERRRQA